MKGKTQSRTISFLIVSMLLYACLSPACFAVDAAEVDGLIKQAEQDLSLAFEATAAAEAAGATVETLLVKIALAGDYLSEAKARLKMSDYESAIMFAKDCSSLVNGVADQATLLSIDAEKAENDRFLLIAAFSSAGLLVFLLMAFLIWRVVRRRYMNQLLETKPEVEESL